MDNDQKIKDYKKAINQLMENLGTDDLPLLIHIYTIMINDYDRKLGA